MNLSVEKKKILRKQTNKSKTRFIVGTTHKVGEVISELYNLLNFKGKQFHNSPIAGMTGIAINNKKKTFYSAFSFIYLIELSTQSGCV